MASIDFLTMLDGVLAVAHDSNKWTGARFENIKRISNSKVGDVGQKYVEAICNHYGIEYILPMSNKGIPARQSSWDLEIAGVKYEIKTATEDVKGSFQFNHIRYHRDYDAVLLIGIGLDSVFYNSWSKAEIVTKKAGTLVSMEKGANASYKLTKRPRDLKTIDKIGDFLNNI